MLHYAELFRAFKGAEQADKARPRFRFGILALLLVGLSPFAAQAKTILVIPGVQVRALTSWYFLNCNTVLGVGTYQLTVAPQHGTVSLGSGADVVTGCPAGSPALADTIANYTFTDTAPGVSADYFQLNYILDGQVYSTIDIYVINTEAQQGKLLGGGRRSGTGTTRTDPCAPCGAGATADTSMSPLSMDGNAASPVSAPNDSAPNASAPSPSAPNFSAPNANSVNRVSAGSDVSSGNLFYATTDYSTAGQNPLVLTRYYNSRGNMAAVSAAGNATVVPLATGFNANWRTSYDRHIEINSTTAVVAERADGQRLTFTLANSIWTPDTDVDISLTQSGSTWTLTDSNDTVETYDNVSLVSGVQATPYAQLHSIKARNGYTQTLNYSGPRLDSVTDSYGRAISFSYSGTALQSATTPDGTTISYGYTGPNLTSASFSTTPATTVKYVYENPSLPYALSGIIDENGSRYATWTYDTFARPVASYLGANQNLTTTVYNTDGSRTVTNALGVTDTYTFTTLQNIPKLASISRAASSTTAAATETFTYDANGYLATQTDWNGNLTQYNNNSHGMPTAIYEAYNTLSPRVTAIVYDSTFLHLPALVERGMLATFFGYDPNGNLTGKLLYDGSQNVFPYSTRNQQRYWAYTWSNFLLISSTGPRTDVNQLTKFAYDSTGALTSITNALGQATRITSHTGGGLPLTVVDPNNVTTTLAYDGRQRLTTSTLSTSTGPLVTRLAYDAAGNLLSTTLPDGSSLTNSYDTAHRLRKITDLFHQNVNYVLNALGDRTQSNLTAVGNRIQRMHSDGFDALGRTIKDVGGVGQTTQIDYDANGNVLTITNPLGHVTTQVFDALNRPTQTTDANGGVTAVTYDVEDRPLTVTDPNGNTTSYVYDAFGDLIGQTSPDSGATVYYYDAGGNRAQKVDAANVVTNRTFDALDRPLTTTYPADAAENVAYKYDQTGHGFGIGRLTSLTDAAGSLSRTFDERGNELSETRTTGAKMLTTSYGYDSASRVASITYPSGWTASYTRDIMGRVYQIPLTAPGGASAGNAISNATYEPFGPLYTLTFGNGVNESRHFDLDYRVTSLTDTGTSPLQNLTYGYDLDDNVVSIADGVNVVNSQGLGYDVLDRLTGAASSYGNLAYTYDPVGNRLSQTLGSITSVYAYMPHTNRLASVTAGSNVQTFGYTATGNISSISSTSAVTLTLGYNKANRYASETGAPVAASYVYDAFGQRITKIAGGSANSFTYGRDQSLIEENDAGFAIDYVYLNGRPVAEIQPSNGKLYFMHDDRLGTPQLATDATQNAVWSATYQPFGTTGSIAASVSQNLRAPGQYADLETGLDYNLNRDYIPPLGRYLEADPIGLIGGSNTYSYVMDRPLVLIDQLGLASYKFIYLCAALPLLCHPDEGSPLYNPKQPNLVENPFEMPSRYNELFPESVDPLDPTGTNLESEFLCREPKAPMVTTDPPAPPVAPLWQRLLRGLPPSLPLFMIMPPDGLHNPFDQSDPYKTRA